MGVSRRQFLQTTLIALATGKIGYDAFKDVRKGYIENQIYNELPRYVHLFTNKAIVDVNGVELEKTVQGLGVAVGDKFITLEHIRVDPYEQINTPFGIITMPTHIKESKFYIGDLELEGVSTNPMRDVAIFKNPGVDVFPCEVSYEYRLGEPIYIVGNPNLAGPNIRKANISDSNGFGSNRLSYGCFGMDKPIQPGDSGTPVVTEDFKLIGLSAAVYMNNFGYAKKMSVFREHIDPDYGKTELEKIAEMPI